MPDDKLPIPQFAAKIKAKYPQYKDMNDTLLTQKIVSKYPEYNDIVDISSIEPSKKKVSLGEVGGQVGGGNGLLDLLGVKVRGSQELPQTTEINKQAKEASTEPQFDVEDPVKSIISPMELRRKEIFDRGIKIESTGQNKLQKKELSDEVNNLGDAIYNIKSNVFPTTQSAQDWLKQYPNTEKNSTSAIAKEVAVDNDKVNNALKSANNNIQDAAINYYSYEDDKLGEQLRTLKKEGQKPPPELLGNLVHNFLQTRTIKELSNSSQQWHNTIKEQSDNLYQNFPELRQQKILSQIAQGRKDFGYNNWFLNLPGTKSSDEIVNSLAAVGKMNQFDIDFYHKYTRPLISVNGDAIPTPGLVENALQSTAKGITDLPKSIVEATGIRDLYKSKGDQLYEAMQENASRTDVPKFGGIQNVSHTLGNLIGVMLPIAGEAKGLQAFNLIKDAGKANEVAMALNFYHDIQQQEIQNNPDNPLLAHLSSLLQAGIWAKLNPTYKTLSGSLIKGIAPEINNTLEQLQKGAIDNQAAIKSISGQVFDAIKTGAKKGVSLANETSAAVGINHAISGIISGDFDLDKTVQDVANNYKNMLISGGILGTLGEAAAIRPQSKFTPEETKAIDAIKERDYGEGFMKMMTDIIKDEKSTPEQKKEALKSIHDQLTDPNTAETVDKQLKGAADAIYDLNYTKPETIDFNREEEKPSSTTIEKPFLKSESKISVITPEENKVAEVVPLKKQANEAPIQEGDNPNKPSELQAKEESQPTESANKEITATGEGTGQPPKEPAETELPFGRQSTTGIAHEIQEGRSYDTKSLPPERGEGVSVEDAIKHGKDLLKEGGNPQEAADQFKKDPQKNISFDALSLVRAEHENLVRETNKAIDDFGENSKQAKEALDKETKWYNDVVKPMQTEWHKIGQAQQGEVDIDTGSYMGLRRSFMQKTGKDFNASQAETAKKLSSTVKSLSKEVESLKAKLTEVLDKGEKEESAKKGIKESAKELANKIRERAKLHKPDSFSTATPASVIWDSAVEIVAKTIEAGGTIAQAIQRGLEHIRESNWYQSLAKDEKKKAEDDFSNFHIEQQPTDIFTRIANKQRGSKFTIDEIKSIWEYAKREYLDKGEDFDSMISKTATDLGISNEQVRDALTTPKGAKQITDAMYKKQNQRNMAIQRAKDWVNASKTSPLVKFLKSIPRFFFAAKVFGHGTVGMVTHAGINIYDPVEWGRYWPIFFKQFKFAYGNQGDYEKAMQDLQNDSQYIFWKRNGLAVDPTKRYDEYQFITNIFNKMGKVGRWLTAGDRGFNALKVYRLERAKSLWKNLSNSEKEDPNTAKEISKLVNHSTGTSGLKISEVANVAFFAPNLEIARWNKLIVDPSKAVKTFTNWNNATPAERAAAKIVAKRAGRILGTYFGALAVNQGLLSLSGANQSINFFNPTKSDWLKFKAGGRTIDLTGGMISLLGFLVRMGHAATASSKDIKNKSRLDELQKQTFSYVTGKASPFASTVKDVASHHDFQGNTLPFYNDKPLHSWNHKMTLGEYLKKQQTPIPVAEFFTDLDKQLQDEGMKRPTINNILQSLLIGGAVGGTGVRIGEEPRETISKPITIKDHKEVTSKIKY